MANERNKILPYALSAIEGVNIQSQEDYTASSETSDGVSTGLANGNNFNKLAKQVSIMSSSLAEFIVNTLAEQTISDSDSIEEISSALNNAILKLIKDNEPVIPDLSGIKVIDDNNTDITSFNQITENGIYYIYKQLSDGPSAYAQYGNICINLIVINIKMDALSIDGCIQLTSLNADAYGMVPSNIGINPMIRPYNKKSQQWEDWTDRYGIIFNKNNIEIEVFTTADKSNIRFPIIAEDNLYDSSYNNFMYSATKEQMREQLGIEESGDTDKDVWTVYTPSIIGVNQRCKSAMYKIYNREINGVSYRCISVIAIMSADITITDKNLYSLTLGVPEGIKIYYNGTALKNGGMASMIYSLSGMDVSQIGGTAIHASPCYTNGTSDRFYIYYNLITDLTTGEKIQSAVLTFQVDTLIDDRELAPTPASIAVTKIQGNQVTITYTRGN